MSNIKSVDHLQNICCLCYNEGEKDIFEDKVLIENYNIDDENEQEDCEINTVDLCKIFQDVDILSLSTNFHLICYQCLGELINSYKFYRKIKQAVKQRQQLDREVQNTSSEHLNDLVIEVFETDNNDTYDGNLQPNNDNCEETFKNPFREVDPFPQIELLVQTPTIQTVESITQPSDSSGHVHQINEHFIDNEDQETEDNCGNTSDCETIFFDENIIYEADHNEGAGKGILKLPEQKRSRLKFLREKLDLTGPSQPPHEGSSLVVTQFVPVKTKISLDKESNNYESTINEIQDISTVDYAAVEVKSSNFKHLHNGELELKNNDVFSEASTQEIFACKYCPNAFTAAAYLIAHLRKSHVCKYCTKAFVKSLDLFVHIRQAHYQHKCAICQKVLSSQSNLRGHIKRVHGIRLPAQTALLDYKSPNI